MTRFFLIAALLLNSCASTQQTTPTGTKLYQYRADLQLHVGDQDFDGIGETKITGPVNITLTSPVGMDRVQVTSCARQDVFEGVKSPYVYTYTPTPAELGGLCPIYFEVFSKKDLTAWGFLAFRGDETLPAHSYCNGAGWQYAGLTVCQTKNGLEQQIAFKQKISKFEAEPGCNLKTTDNLNFTFTPALGFCRATFAAVDDKGAIIWHRLITLGYDSVLMRN